MKTFEEYQYRFSIPHNKVKLGYKYTPSTKGELVEAIEAEIELQGPEADLNCIDTSKITDMSDLFYTTKHEYAKNFNGDISTWDVSNVKNMASMFYCAESFNRDISGWNVGNVKYMNFMFEDAKNFNQDISKWDTSSVTDMGSMFWDAKSFNQNISNWNVSNVLNMDRMFEHAESFNQDISNWDVSKVIYVNNMFIKCPIKGKYKPKFN